MLALWLIRDYEANRAPKAKPISRPGFASFPAAIHLLEWVVREGRNRRRSAASPITNSRLSVEPPPIASRDDAHGCANVAEGTDAERRRRRARWTRAWCFALRSKNGPCKRPVPAHSQAICPDNPMIRSDYSVSSLSSPGFPALFWLFAWSDWETRIALPSSEAPELAYLEGFPDLRRAQR